MKTQTPNPARQSGYMLLEVLVSVLIFSVGVLGLVGLQATSIQNVAASKNRSDAAFLADQLIGQMWADDRTPATLQINYQGGNGTDGGQYTTWLNNIVNTAQLPGVTANSNVVPTVVVTPSPLSPTTTSHVVITLYWLSPGNPTRHSYTADAQISQ